MSALLAEWHAARNSLVADEHAERARRFGLRLLAPDSEGLPPVIDNLAGRTIWAWQPASPALAATGDDRADVRVGVAGSRLHLGHLSLARDVAWLREKGHSVTLISRQTRTTASATVVELLAERVKQFDGRAPDRVIDLDAAEVRAFEDDVLSGLVLRRMRQVYGWSDDTRLSLLRDAVTMMSFFLYEQSPRGSIALVDAGQVTHTALMRTVSDRLAAPTPYVAYRRLVPNLRRRGGRASINDPASTILLTDRPDTVREKFIGAVTGGRARAEEQRQYGGNPNDCPTFEVIELLSAPERATAVARRCRAGEVLCGQCKIEHLDDVIAGVRGDGRQVALARVGTSSAVPKAVAGVVPSLHRPPSREPVDLEAEIARYVGVVPEQVVVGHGTTEILDWIMCEQASAGAAVLATAPTFELYGQLAARNELRYDEVAWDGGALRHDLAALRAALKNDHAAMVVDIPHTISAISVPLSDLLAVVAPQLPSGAKLVIDNVYGEFMAHPLSLTPRLLEERDELVVCRSLSKAHCLLGARVGYAVTSAGYADRLRRHRLPYAVSALAATAARASLGDDRSLRRTIGLNRRAYATLTAELDRLYIGYARSDANFLLIDLGDRRDQILALLRARGLRFRDGARWQLPSMIQVHLIDEATVAPLVRALRDLC
ncbi:aminotransferase class I/II-fold pyridoxal phosphate-dependent enzyme [Micromonospora sp. NPDC051196]|uniref:aminotransferase class I/II-fold pyridoxal phosphate-dependent enzyme n=1 Tax=Micromonospora sp. NPDC051196 TaxID=3155281 RepID=UPI003440A44F